MFFDIVYSPLIGDYVAIALLEGQLYWVLGIIKVVHKQCLPANHNTHLK